MRREQQRATAELPLTLSPLWHAGVENKIAMWTLLPPGNGEGLQVLRYTKSQHYDAVSGAPLAEGVAPVKLAAHAAVQLALALQPA